MPRKKNSVEDYAPDIGGINKESQYSNNTDRYNWDLLEAEFIASGFNSIMSFFRFKGIPTNGSSRGRAYGWAEKKAEYNKMMGARLIEETIKEKSDMYMHALKEDLDDLEMLREKYRDMIGKITSPSQLLNLAKVVDILLQNHLAVQELIRANEVVENNVIIKDLEKAINGKMDDIWGDEVEDTDQDTISENIKE